MKIEDQCVNLELAKQLKSLGVKQDSLFYWEQCNEFGGGLWTIIYADLHNTITGEWGDGHCYQGKEIYSAFTSAELGEMLPSHSDFTYIKTCKGFFKARMNKWILNEVTHQWHKREFMEETEANARATMLIYLIENKIIEVPK